MGKKPWNQSRTIAPPTTAGGGGDRSQGMGAQYRPRPVKGVSLGDMSPDIVLKAKGFNLAISFFYSVNTSSVTPFGAGRSASVKCRSPPCRRTGGCRSARGLLGRRFLQRGHLRRDHDLHRRRAFSGPSTADLRRHQVHRALPDGMRWCTKLIAGGKTPFINSALVFDANGNAHTYSYGTRRRGRPTEDHPGARRQRW